MRMSVHTKFHRAWLVLIGCCFIQAGAFGVVLSCCGVFFNPVCDELGFTQGQISGYMTLYSWATCVGAVIVSRIFTRIDTRITLSVCTVLLAVFYGAMAFYDSLWQWYLSGIVFGLAGSFIFVIPIPVLIGNWFSKNFGLAVGIATACSGLGGALFAPLLTGCIGAIGWRATYMVGAVIILVLCLPWTTTVLRLKPELMGLKPYGADEDADGERERADEDGAAGTQSTTAKKAAVWTISFFCLFSASGLASSFAGYNNQLPTFALTIGQTTMFGAALLSTAQMGNVIGKIVVGACIDRFGALRTTLVQLSLIVVALIMFLIAQLPALLFVCAFVFGSHHSLVSTNIPALLRNLCGGADYSKMVSLLQIGTGIVGGIGIPLAAVLFDATGSFALAFAVGIGIAVLIAALVVIAALRSHASR